MMTYETKGERSLLSSPLYLGWDGRWNVNERDMSMYDHKLSKIIFSTVVMLCLLGFTSLVFAQSNWWEPSPGSATGNGVSGGSGSAEQPSIAVAPAGDIYVAWMNVTYWVDETNTVHQTSDIYVKYFNGIDWEEVGVSSASDGGINNDDYYARDPTIIIAPNGIPYVTWQSGINGTSNWNIYIRRFNGTVWEEIGTGSATGDGISNSQFGAQFPVLDITPDNIAYVAWSDSGDGSSSSTFGIYVRRFNGIDWEEVGLGSASCCTGGISMGEGPGNNPTIAIDGNGTPYVAWEGGFLASNPKIYIRRFNGMDWEEVDTGSASWPSGISGTFSNAHYPSLDIAPDGTPYVAWSEWISATQYEIYILRFNGTVWEEVGFGSASDGGMSNTPYPYNSLFPSLTINADAVPHVSWQEYDGWTWEIFVRHFDGTNWVGTGTDADGGEGISDETEDAETPKVTASESGTLYAAWSNRISPSVANIHVRRYDSQPFNAAPLLNYYTTATPTLTWSAITWATEYELQVDNSSTFTLPLEFTTIVPAGTLEVSPTVLEGVHYWRVRAKNGSTLGSWGTAQSFTIDLP